MSARPLDVLEEALNETVTVRLKDGTAFVGELVGYDQHMNVVLEGEIDADEAPPGDTDPGVEPVEDTTIIRGDNVVTINA